MYLEKPIDDIQSEILGAFGEDIRNKAHKTYDKQNSTRKLIKFPTMTFFGKMKVQNGLPANVKMLSNGRTVPIIYNNLAEWKARLGFIIQGFAIRELAGLPSVPSGEAEMSLDVLVPIPNKYVKTPEMWYLCESGMMVPITRPDLDNYLKALLDSTKQILWKDDNQVVTIRLNKGYSARPRVVMSLSVYDKPLFG